MERRIVEGIPRQTRVWSQLPIHLLRRAWPRYGAVGADVGTQDWANMAVAELEALEDERMAIQEQRANAVDGNNERRLASISAEVDELYAKLNTQAEQIAGQVVDVPESHEAPADSTPAEDVIPSPPSRSRRPRSIDTVVVEYPAKPGVELARAEQGSVPDVLEPDAWKHDERLQLRGAFEALEKSREENTRAFENAAKSLEGQAQELVELKAQAEAARLALQRFEETQASVESKLAAAQEQLAQRREQEARAKHDLAAMEAKVRSEYKLLVGLDKVRDRIESVERALKGAVSSADQERTVLATSVDQALDAAERATRQAEEMRDAAERAHQRAQQAIAHAQEVETRSEVREQELLRIIDGLEGQMVGLNHEKSSIEQQLQELRVEDGQAATPLRPATLVEQAPIEDEPPL